MGNSNPGFERVRSVIHDGLVNNHHPHVIAGMAVASAEMLRNRTSLRRAIVANSKALARALDDDGLKVLCADRGYTESHLVMVDASSNEVQMQRATLFEKCGIVVTKISLPWDGERLTGLRDRDRRGHAPGG